MRRPLLIIFILVLIVSYPITNIFCEDVYEDKSNINLIGIVKGKKTKAKYDEYIIDKFLVRDYTKRKNIMVGLKVNVDGKFNSLNSMKFDDFDYGKYLRSNGYEGVINLNDYKVIGESKIFKYLGRLKIHIRSTTRYLYKVNSDFINSLILGEKYEMTSEQKEVFSRTGTSHIIAISGLHTGILCVFIAILIGRINEYYKLIILISLLTLYSMMIDKSPSIIRAIFFTAILYLSIFTDRKRDGISTLSFIGIFLVINNPYIIYNISFQLSFLSTLSIIYFYGYINKSINMSLVSITIASNILTLPIIYYNFNGIPISSIISNIIIVPFIGIIMYMSIVSVILFNVNMGISKLIAYFNNIIIDNIYYILNKISELDFLYLEIVNPNLIYVIIYYVVVFSYMIYREMKVMKEQANELQGYYRQY